MTDTVLVRLEPGKALFHPGVPSVDFLCHRPVKPGETAVHVVPGGKSYAYSGPERVPNDTFTRRAIRRGDLVLVDETPTPAPSRPSSARAARSGSTEE